MRKAHWPLSQNSKSASVAIGKIGGGRRANQKICHFDTFWLKLSQQNTVNLSFPILRQPCPQSFLAFTLKQKDVLWTGLAVIEWRSNWCYGKMQWDLVDVWNIFFGHWVKDHFEGYYYSHTHIYISFSMYYRQSMEFRVDFH